MKQIAVIRQEIDLNGSNLYREAVRGLILEDDKILLIKVKKYNVYHIPGGGIESDESMGQALKREIEEETGYIIDDHYQEYGYIAEYKKDFKKEYDNFIQKSYYFICHIAKKGTVNLELYEKEEKYEAQFVSIKEAIEANKVYLTKEQLSPAATATKRDTLILEDLLENQFKMNYIKELPFQIPLLQGGKFTPITSGWSNDLKYEVVINKERYLLRLSNASDYSQKEETFLQIQRLNKLSPHFQKALHIGITNDKRFCYEIFSYEEGVLASDYIKSFSPERQYQLGYRAGELLRLMHQLKPTKKINSYTKIKTKLARKEEDYQYAGYKLPYYELMLGYIKSYLKENNKFETSFCHGDYHLGNMIISPESELKIIDFNRAAYEDPDNDFNRMLVWSRKLSTEFVKGQIDGYFNGQVVPDTFWRKILFYVTIDMAYGIIWAQKFGDEEINILLENNEMLLKDYNFYQDIIPQWYRKEKEYVTN
ncbi:MAG: phosphotransferase [Bacilli bacterium]|jgi:aminoglycoside phosphotransferase (APT) family kinase protein/8-oxo-dGTP pyrophosphatase MutT (NUDIX family)